MEKTQDLHFNKFNKHRFTIAITLFLSCFIALQFTYAQETSEQKTRTSASLTPTEIWEAGLPHIENFTSDDFKNSPQNWEILEGNDGLLYFGNTGGVVQYDGSSWNSFELDNKSLVRSLAKKNREIFVGGVHELGYLEANEIGMLEFHSLLSNLNNRDRKFTDVWSTLSIEDDIFFVSNEFVFRWDGNKFKTWEPKTKFGSAFKVENNLFVENKGVGIQKIKGDSLVLIPGGKILKNNNAKIDAILTHQSGNLLLVTADKGLLLFDGKTTTLFNKNSNNAFLENRIYKGIVLTNGDYALATLTSGLYILDGKTGVIKKRLGKKHGLISDVLFNVYEDSQGSIWVVSDNGISKIDWASPFRSFNELNGLDERVRSVSYQSNKFLVDSKGLYQLVKSTEGRGGSNGPYFKRIEGIENAIRFFIPLKDDLLAFDSEFIYLINQKSQSRFIKKESWALTSIMKSKVDSSKIYAGTLEGQLFECKLLNNEWLITPILNLDGGIEGLVEEPNGDLWLQTYFNGLIFGQRQTDNLKNTSFKLKKYDTLSGLPSMTYNFPYEFQNKIYVTTQDGMYQFNRNNNTFYKDSLLTGQYDKSVSAYGYMGMDHNGKIWQTVRAGFENKIYNLSENKLTELNEYKIFNDFSTYSMEFLENIILFTGPKGILLYNQNKTRPDNKNLSTKIRKVWMNNDSLIYVGSGFQRTTKDSFELRFKNNNLKFEFTLPYFIKTDNNSFQYLLEGFDENWSTWSSETKKDYTNIPAGHYTFKVRSKNIFNQIGKIDSYSFKVLPPWYATWWAYLSYAFGIVAMVALILRWRSKELKRKNETLENLIAERTTEIRHKNQLLNHQTEQLVQLNESKTKLYSNITHEFRTPLTVILGMADTLKSNVKDKRFTGAEKSIEMIRRNGKNLLQLVNELLDLAKVESGSMELKLVQTDAIPFLKYLSESFHSLAESKKINLTVYSEIETLEMDLDVNKMASIISNLLSNAIKFTAENGKIIVHLNEIKKDSVNLLTIKVKDNGLGLAEKDILHLFDRFYQANNESLHYQEGTGIGLSLAKEFVELMNGTIDVESTLGKGSTFTVQLPVTNSAIKIVDTKISFEPPTKTKSNSIKTESQVFDETSALPLALIIEDNEDVAHYLKTCLKGKYQTIHAINGILGIEMAYKKIPDIIISDVMMPGKDGFEVCSILKSDKRTDHIPIVLLTAKVTTEDRLAGLSHGADAYLAKPFNEKELFIRLDQLVLLRKKFIEKIKQDGLNNFLDKRAESPETKFLQRAIQYINEDISNSAFGASDLANKLFLSESQIYRKLKAITDKSTAIFIRSIRLQKAKELIETTDKTISEIAYDTGFNDPSWFSRAFKEEFGFPPSNISK